MMSYAQPNDDGGTTDTTDKQCEWLHYNEKLSTLEMGRNTVAPPIILKNTVSEFPKLIEGQNKQ